MKQNFTVRRGALDGVEAFLSVAQHRSFRRAAVELGVTPSAISQAVRALEARIGATLFIRTTRSVGLTDAGERFLARAKPAFEELVAASGVARDLGQRPAGQLRLTVPRAVVPILLEPLIASFCRAYPEVEVEIAVSAELVDLPAEGFDAGIRLVKVCDESLNARKTTIAFRVTVENAIAPLLPHGQAHASAVAKKLGMSERTLARRLATEGVTFMEVLQQLKANLASRYLEDAAMPISRAAWLLGFRDASSFSHAFRRWTGKSPRELRGCECHA
jgi:AraC-like DNA-binding protein